MSDEWRAVCPVCKSHDTKPDTDFPDTMQNCNVCGSEWNEMEITLNAKEVE